MNERVASALAVCAAVATLVVGVAFGTATAGGSDSSCYLNSARLLSRGAVAFDDPLARAAPWPRAEDTFTPAGFTPSPAERFRLVPICSPGLSLTMAAFRLLHLSPFLVVPLLGALAVWMTYLLGRAIDGTTTGAAAALLLACSPTFLYQVVQPMSDVPAMAWWTAALMFIVGKQTEAGAGLAGLAVAAALLTRPNLAPLGGVLAVYLVASGGGTRLTRASWFIAGTLPGILILALLQRAMYGSPLATGYGSIGQLMSIEHVRPNLARYLTWLIAAHTPFLLLSAAAPFVVRGWREAWLLACFALATFACYLPYTVFDDWWYTRFLLPMLPPLVVLSVMTAAAVVGRASRHQLLVTVAYAAILMTVWIRTARERQAFDLAALERHYSEAALAAQRVEGPAAIVTLKDSGSVRYETGHPTISWDTLDPEALDGAIAFARSRGYAVYLLLENDEEPVFRDRFGGQSLVGRLDWPPAIQVGRTIRLYDPGDRAPFLANGTVKTTFVAAPVRSIRDWRRWLRR